MSAQSDETIRAITQALKKQDDSALSTHQQQMLTYFSFADDAIRQFGRGQAVKIIRDQYKVTQATAYNYIRGAEYVFGTQYKYEKAYHKGLLIETYDRLIFAAMRSCLMMVDVKQTDDSIIKEERIVDAEIFKSLAKYLEGKERLLGLHLEDPPFDPEELMKLPIFTARPEDVGISLKEIPESILRIYEKYGAKHLLLQPASGTSVSTQGE